MIGIHRGIQGPMGIQAPLRGWPCREAGLFLLACWALRGGRLRAGGGSRVGVLGAPCHCGQPLLPWTAARGVRVEATRGRVWGVGPCGAPPAGGGGRWVGAWARPATDDGRAAKSVDLTGTGNALRWAKGGRGDFDFPPPTPGLPHPLKRPGVPPGLLRGELGLFSLGSEHRGWIVFSHTLLPTPPPKDGGAGPWWGCGRGDGLPLTGTGGVVVERQEGLADRVAVERREGHSW